MRKSKVYNMSDDDFQLLIENSNSFAKCCTKIGLSINGSNGKTQIEKRCKELGISHDHFTAKPRPIEGSSHQARYTLDEILVENSSYTNRDRLKKRLISEGRLEYKCAICGNTGEWLGEKLSLQLDHINGINNDHRIENLRFLCPNCHSQTDTFSGKNKTTTS